MEVRPIGSDGLVGIVATRGDGPPGPPVLVLGGSDGGIPHGWAELFAGHGLTCLALAYFGAPGLPRTLVEIPLEYVERALEWFAATPEVDGARVPVLGMSRGSELALMVGARFPERVRAVVALTPASVCFAGLTAARMGSRRSAWSHRGVALPFVPIPFRLGRVSRRGFGIRPIYEAALRDEAAVARAAIPVEQIDGPVLLVSGDADGMWPATPMAQALVARAVAHGRPDQVTHLHYPGAGHLLSREARAAVSRLWVQRFIDFGGTAEADAAAGDDALPKILELLGA